MANIRFVEMSMPRTTWVKVNRLRTGVGRLHSSMHDEVSPLLKLLVRRQRGNRRSRLKSVPRIEYYMWYVVWWFLMMTPDAGSTSSLPASDPNSLA